MIASGMAVTFLVMLTAIDMFWTHARVRMTERAITAGDPEARTSLYQITIGYLWPVAGVAALLIGVGFGRAAFGFRMPELSHLHGIYAGSVGGLVLSYAAMLWPRQGEREGGTAAEDVRPPHADDAARAEVLRDRRDHGGDHRGDHLSRAAVRDARAVVAGRRPANHAIINDASLLQKTTFVRDGKSVIWNGSEFVAP